MKCPKCNVDMKEYLGLFEKGWDCINENCGKTLDVPSVNDCPGIWIDAGSSGNIIVPADAYPLYTTGGISVQGGTVSVDHLIDALKYIVPISITMTGLDKLAEKYDIMGHK